MPDGPKRTVLLEFSLPDLGVVRIARDIKPVPVVSKMVNEAKRIAFDRDRLLRTAEPKISVGASLIYLGHQADLMLLFRDVMLVDT